jgi:hypothetical protein
MAQLLQFAREEVAIENANSILLSFPAIAAFISRIGWIS